MMCHHRFFPYLHCDICLYNGFETANNENVSLLESNKRTFIFRIFWIKSILVISQSAQFKNKNGGNLLARRLCGRTVCDKNNDFILSCAKAFNHSLFALKPNVISEEKNKPFYISLNEFNLIRYNHVRPLS